jgi:hypothetical protein
MKSAKNSILETAVLLLLMGMIYEVCCWDGLRWHDAHMKFYEDGFCYSGNTEVITSTIWEATVLVLLMKGMIMYAAAVTSDGIIL